MAAYPFLVSHLPGRVYRQGDRRRTGRLAIVGVCLRHHFAALFGLEALGRIRGFSPAEMALPNQPDAAYEFVRTLVDCGYEWVLVQEHTVEQPGGRGVERPHLPHRLVCTDSRGSTASIIAVIKTQGSDTKLVGQMQPLLRGHGPGAR
jgi:hypothetical protein